MRSSSVGIWLHSLPDGELDWNENTKAHFHLPPHARPTLETFYQRIHEEDRQRVRDAVAHCVRQGQPFDTFFRTVGPDGEQKWIHGVGRATLDDHGRARRIDGVSFDITVHVAAQQRLREFADIAPAMLWVTGLEGACIFLSRGWTLFTGQAEIEGLGFGWLDMVHPNDRERARASFREADARRVEFSMEHRLRRIDGSWRWVIDAGRPHLGIDGEFLGFVGSVTDIHDRRMAEGALRRSSERYRHLLESIDQGFCVVQVLLDEAGRPADHRFLETNAVFERMTGLREAVGRTAREVIPGLEEFWIQIFGEVALTGQPRRVSRESAALGGRWFDVFATPIGDPGERQVAILFEDVSLRVEHERRLLESEERYRAFVANSSEGIWRMEFQPPVDTRLPPAEQAEAFLRSGRFAECNQAFARMYGLASPADVVGHGLELAMDPGSPELHAYLMRLVEAGYRASEVESMEHGRDGQPLWFANNLSGVIEGGLLLRAWGTQRNITLRKRAEAALVEADRRKDEFLATLAHELRNPLAPIRASAELLRITSGQDPRLARHAEVIGRQVGHLARMIDDLMDASRISRGKLELRVAPIVLQDVVRTALESVLAELQAGRHPLQLELPGEPIRLIGDEVRLVQAVQNLLTNAARYSADGQPIGIAVTTEDGQAVLRVRDQGVGIAADQLPRLFELFFQGGSPSERAIGGLGIGLALTRQLAELHHGSVEARSDGLGRGSEFTVRLPLPVGPVPAPERAGDARATGAQGLRVLIVDDNRDAADMLAEVMRLMGDEVSTAYDGVEGLARAEALRPDVVILDLGMPRLDGYGACRALRATEWGRTMTVVALTGWGQPADLQRAADAGFDGHLVKPVAPDALARTIEELRARRASEAVAAGDPASANRPPAAPAV